MLKSFVDKAGSYKILLGEDLQIQVINIQEKISYFELLSLPYPILHNPDHLSIQEFPINKFPYI